jgi:tyrosine-protein kinase Etk/Wzc
MNSPHSDLKKDFEDDGGLDIKRVFTTFRNYWYLFVAAVIICVSLAFLYTQSTSPTFKVSSEITVEDQSNSPLGKSSGNNGNIDFSDLLGTANNAYNEMDIVKSRNLMFYVVKEMLLNITIFKVEQLRLVELYKDAPFDVIVIGKSDLASPRAFDVETGQDEYHIKSKIPFFHSSTDQEKPIDLKAKYGQPVSCGQFSLIVTKRDGSFDLGSYRLTIQSIDSKIEELSKRLNVELTDKKSTTMALSFDYSNPDKGEAILQKLMDVYMRFNVLNKQEIADSTLSFIDNRLQIVSSELSEVENKFTDFKRQNNLAAVDEQEKALVGTVVSSKSKQDELDIQLTVLDAIAQKLNDPNNKQLIPSSLAVEDPVFIMGITAYNQLLIQRGQLDLSYKETNPIVKNLDAQIEAAHQSLLKSFSAYRSSLLVSMAAIKGQNANLYGQVKTVPGKERIFLDYSRQQNLKQELYLYLLQKREETAISRTSTLSTARIIDPAKSAAAPFKPNKMLILLIGLGCGIVLPLVYVSLKRSLSNRIMSKDDVTGNTTATIVGEIGNSPENKLLAVENTARSLVSEQFRALRTNLQFVLKSEQSNSILITSSMSSEGKSFISVNLASIIALSGKKVILLELDLRKPKLSDYMGVSRDFGFSNYAIATSVLPRNIIKPSGISENIHIVPSGPIPPNPAELLLSSRLKELIEELKKEYDYIIIDSAPIGLVSDAQLIEPLTDISLYVVRQGYTYKSQLNILNELMAEGKFRRPYVVINDIKHKKRAYYGYGYYGSNYGDYIQGKKSK